MTKTSTEDQLKGKFHEIKGTLKDKAARAAGNPEQAAAGRAEKLAGKVQQRRDSANKASRAIKSK